MRCKLALLSLMFALTTVALAEDAPAPALKDAKVDTAALKDWGTRTYNIVRISSEGLESPAGSLSLKTTINKDHIQFEDTMKLDQREAVVTSKVAPVATLNITEATIVAKRDDVTTNGTVTVKDNQMTVTLDGKEKPVANAPENSISVFSFFRLVTLLPRDAGGKWTVDGILNDFKFRWRNEAGMSIECRGPQKVEVNGKENRWTHFVLNTGQGERKQIEAWVDEKGQVCEIYLDNMKLTLAEK